MQKNGAQVKLNSKFVSSIREEFYRILVKNPTVRQRILLWYYVHEFKVILLFNVNWLLSDTFKRRFSFVQGRLLQIYRRPDGRLMEEMRRRKSNSPHHLLHPFRYKGGKRCWWTQKTYGDVSSLLQIFECKQKMQPQLCWIKNLPPLSYAILPNMAKIPILNIISYYWAFCVLQHTLPIIKSVFKLWLMFNTVLLIIW